jgi:hypothetical protein
VEAPWKNLRGPARTLAISATVLLVASGLLGVEAGTMILLGEARGMVIKPFILLGYLEVCAIFFSIIFIAAGIVALIFYRPYLFIAEKILVYRERRAAQTSNNYTSFEGMGRHAYVYNPEEDGAPD